jgi:uncharacterized protein YegL
MIASHNRTPLLRELQSLAAQVTGEEIILLEGEAGCSWSWNWRDRVITVSPDFLTGKSADVCRAILLHESAHCAITRIQHLLEPSTRRLYQDLLNVLEDLRIESWLSKKFPGCAAWLHTANELIFRSIQKHPWPQSLQVQFLRGLLETAHTGEIPAGPHEDVRVALLETRHAVEDQTACHPDIAVGRAAARETLNAQQRMLAIFEEKIRPVWERLVAIDESQGRPRITTRMDEDGHPMNGPIDKRIDRARRSKKGGGADSPRQRCAPQGPAYLARQRRLAPLIDRLAEEFLHLFATTSRDKFQRQRNSGERLDIRLAMQAQADPRLHDKLWIRRQHHARFDPLVVLALDCSGSMEGANFNAAFDGVVLLSEVCLRAGIPMALWTFNNEIHQILRPHGQSDSTARQRRIDHLRTQCGGGTEMDTALERIFSSPELHQFTHPLVFVLGDGCPSDKSSTLARIAKFDAAEIPLIGLGIGPDTAEMSSLFKNAIVGLDINKVATTLCATLRKTLRQMVPATPHQRAA